MLTRILDHMKTVIDQINIVKDHFPLHKNKIEDLYHDDPVFRTLCNDYIYCLEYLEKLRIEFAEKMNSVGEYERVKQDLEGDLNEYFRD